MFPSSYLNFGLWFLINKKLDIRTLELTSGHWLLTVIFPLKRKIFKCLHFKCYPWIWSVYVTVSLDFWLVCILCINMLLCASTFHVNRLDLYMFTGFIHIYQPFIFTVTYTFVQIKNRKYTIRILFIALKKWTKEAKWHFEPRKSAAERAQALRQRPA